jgi:hypothetical protein
MFQQDALAAAGPADNDKRRPLVDRQVHIIQDTVRIKTFGDVSNLDRMHYGKMK